LHKATPQALQQALMSLSSRQLSGRQSSLTQMNPTELVVKRLVYELGRKGELERLRGCLQDPEFRQSHLRAPVISKLLELDTPKRNYELSKQFEFPKTKSDAEEMRGKMYVRTLQRTMDYIDIDPQQLQGKRILLIGGGLSPIRQNLEEMGVYPEIITNVDKFLPHPDARCEHLKIGEDFNSATVDQHLADKKNKYDEVWVVFSLPAYAETTQDVVNFYKRALKSLKKGGTLRIFPTGTAVRKKNSPQNQEVTPIDYPSDLFPALNDNQTLSRPYIYQKSMELIDYIKNRHQFFTTKDYVTHEVDCDAPSPYCWSQTGVNITLKVDPENVDKIV